MLILIFIKKETERMAERVKTDSNDFSSSNSKKIDRQVNEVKYNRR